MKRTCLISCALATAILAPQSASAEPGILYIPTDPVTLRPTGVAPCGSDVNSALGCGGASSEVEEPPFAGAADLTTAMAANLVDFDVLVTNTRPPEYISYMMLLASDEPLDMASAAYPSFTCSFGGINCGARQRNDIASTSGTTENCIDPEIVHAAMYTFGRNSGLEGVDNPEDWMNYVNAAGPAGGPDYTTPPLGFQDVCNDRIQQQGFNDRGMQVSLPLECTSVDHFECDGPGGMQGQNSFQDLLLYYGARQKDVDPPVLENVTPADATVLMQGDDLVLDVDITDNDPVVGARWTIQSDAIISDDFPDGIVAQCTNDVCAFNWADAAPLKATDSDWSVTLGGLPAGDYVITLEAADYHGNVAETITVNVTIEAPPATDETGAEPDTGNGSGGNEEGGVFTTGADGSGGTGDNTAGADDGDDAGGCSCRTDDEGGRGAGLMLLGLMGLGAMRRRRR